MRVLSAFLASGLLIGFSLVASPAQADVSSWLGVGFGPSYVWHEGKDELFPSLRLETGMGSDPGGPIIVGGLFGAHTHFGHGTDLSLSLRTTTHEYTNGGWGVAMDLGGYYRTVNVSEGFVGSLTLGAPWGITVAAGGSYGTHDSQSVHALIGFDFARLTIYRRTGGRWWPNSLPAYRPETED